MSFQRQGGMRDLHIFEAMKNIITLLFAGAILLSSCIGTDEVDDPIVGASIVRTPISFDSSNQPMYIIPLLLGDSGMVAGTYFNQYGLEDDLQILWESEEPSIASVDIAGLVIGQSAGQTNVVGSVGAISSGPFLINVVETEDEVAMVAISSSIGQQIEIGQNLTLNISITNLLGTELGGLNVDWASSDEEILSVDTDGIVTGIADGFAEVYATVEGIESNRLGIMVGRTSRTGTFQGAGGYDATGTAELFLDDNGNLMLSLSDDFDTDFALGTFVYLSNSTSGSTTASSGLEISGISEGGAALFNVSAVDSDVSINDYNYVIMLCKPATITFGFAQLD